MGKCSHCGRPREVCADSAAKFYPQLARCNATMELHAAQRRFDDLHGQGTGRRWHNGDETQWAEKRSAATPYYYSDGRQVWVADVDLEPDATWLSGESGDGDEERGDH